MMYSDLSWYYFPFFWHSGDKAGRHMKVDLHNFSSYEEFSSPLPPKQTIGCFSPFLNACFLLSLLRISLHFAIKMRARHVLLFSVLFFLVCLLQTLFPWKK